MNFHAAKAYILNRLERHLSSKLSYHSLHHTLDVLQVTTDLCQLENISPYETMLLKTAALYHDSGFLISNVEHEKLGCGIAREILPNYQYTAEEIERICGMIMATKIPQSPQNKLEEIICDADLDYLGRKDFYSIGDTLFQELRAHDVLKDDFSWNQLQVKFLKAHQFFTITNQSRRETQKQAYLTELEEWLTENLV